MGLLVVSMWLVLTFLASGIAWAENPATLKSDWSPQDAPWFYVMLGKGRMQSWSAGRGSLAVNHFGAGMSAVTDDEMERIRGRERGEEILLELKLEMISAYDSLAEGGDESDDGNVEASYGKIVEKKYSLTVKGRDEHYCRHREYLLTIQRDVELWERGSAIGGFSTRLNQFQAGR